ncbi:MAG TPA: exodeoxyribonuclease III [Bacilli bacterium]|nr:MAG: Exodeoxyribonuclease [Tenericutes bacterium ADurb.BinA124]HOH18670.1 exodeoxyribonuclease III [Bacilli bacterium]HPN61540.1 exodeoxyribonuclease III [Bacilli bacterium]
MKMVSWNVNGLRAAMTKGFEDFFEKCNADFFAIQETKMQEEQKTFAFPGYHEYWHSALKKGYSGTLIYTKQAPLSVTYGLDNAHMDEGRIITLEYPDFYFVTSYSPNSQPELARLDYRMAFEDDFRAYLMKLDQHKPVIVCGDLNVAHREIDLKNPKANERNPGFSIEERTKFQALLDSGFTDSFRYFYPEKIKYTWWSYRANSRANNVGWRIDYFLVSNRLASSLHDSYIHDEVMGSDHCPVSIEIF